MMKLMLAHTGGVVVIPDAVEMQPGDDESRVHFLDGNGRVLISFYRADLAAISHSEDSFPEDGASEPAPTECKA